MNDDDARLEEALRAAAPASGGFLEAVMARVREAEAPRRTGRMIPLPLRWAAAAAAVLLVTLAALPPSPTPPSEGPAPVVPTRTTRYSDIARRARLFVAQIDQAPDEVLVLDLEASGLADVDPDELMELPARDRELARGVVLAARAARNGAPVAMAELRGLLR